LTILAAADKNGVSKRGSKPRQPRRQTMANLRITKTTPWTAADGSKHKQVEIMLCKIEKEDADWVEYSVTEVESINNAPSFYAPTTGGAVSKKFLNDYEGKVGMTLVSKA
jgi:hypothetical protein